MAALEGFERSYRLRNSADDDLLSQVFGKDEVAELSASRPALIETARAYFPHLTSSTYDRLMREPDSLHMEQDRCAREMEQLAVQNYGAFIGSAKVTQAVQQGLAEIQSSLDEMAESLQPLQDGIREFQTSSLGLTTRRASLRNVMQQHGPLLELLELPELLHACVRNSMYDESLELLAYCSSMLSAHEARGEEIPALSQLQEQVAVQRSNLHSSLVGQLRTDIHLPACVRLIGFLRRLQRHTEEELRNIFIEHRQSFLDGQKQQVESLRGNRGSVLTALKNAADILRTHVYDIGTQYRALFPQDDGPLGIWLSEQVAWLMGLLRTHLLPPRAARGCIASPHGASPHGASAAPASPSTKSSGFIGVWSQVQASRIDATSLATVLRQCYLASTALRRLGSHFFPAVAGVFEARMEHHVCELLDFAMMNFHDELKAYDWVASTALAGGSGASAAGSGGSATGGPSHLHPQALELTRHRPLAVFTNDIVQVFNELRQCTLYSLRAPVVQHCFECLTGAVNLLRSVLGSQAIQYGTPKATEFTKLCQHFAWILVPLVAAHLEAVFGVGTRLDSEAVLASMVPDLVSSVDTEHPVAPDADGDLVSEAEVAASEEAPAAEHAHQSLEHADSASGKVDLNDSCLVPTELVASETATESAPTEAATALAEMEALAGR